MTSEDRMWLEQQALLFRCRSRSEDLWAQLQRRRRWLRLCELEAYAAIGRRVCEQLSVCPPYLDVKVAISEVDNNFVYAWLEGWTGE